MLSPAGEDSVRIAWAELRAADPEVLVIACCGHAVARTLRELPILEALAGWHELRAVRSSRVYAADGSAYFSRPGPTASRHAGVDRRGPPPRRPPAYPDRGVVRLYT